MMRREKYLDRFGLALILVALTMIMMAVTGTSGWGRILTLVVKGGTLLFIFWTAAVRPQALVLAAVLVVGAIAAASVSVVRGGASSDGAIYAVSVVLLLGAPVAIVRRLLMELRVTASTVFGALCVYLIAGLLFAYVYGLLGATDQGRFFVQVRHPQSIDYLYFSLATLTTLGYGDFTAAGDLGRMLAVTEALAGQMYLVSVVAVLVANMGRARQRHERGGASSEDRAESPGVPERTLSR
jgi:hypothetical protein